MKFLWLSLIAAPANALLLLKAAAVIVLYRLLSTRGSLWKTWTSHETRESTAIPETIDSASLEPFAPGAENGRA